MGIPDNQTPWHILFGIAAAHWRPILFGFTAFEVLEYVCNIGTLQDLTEDMTEFLLGFTITREIIREDLG